MPIAKPIDERFWSFVRKSDGCWLWIGYRFHDGYGYLTCPPNKKKRRAHRLSYEINVGPIPKGLGVLHKCDVCLCVNPDHLFLGTAKDNAEDCVRKRRHAFGIKNGGGKKLDNKTVVMIRRMRNSGKLLRDISAIVGVHLSTVSKICRRSIWRHIP